MPEISSSDTFVSELPETWQIRPCDVYYEEYKDCKSIKARFQQYFVHGEPTDCMPWRRDYDNCTKFLKSKDLKAARALIESEKERRRERFKGHYANDVWTRRDKPPENWSAPLPEAISKDYEKSYLYMKSREMKGEIPPSSDIDGTLCVIM
ncbi:synaptic plasticity regulator PANTS [Culicoides brevitarsis]|uniref:synaptic plasticity regulator PANTS n=1 Tax=Culicoides brevitarsis TaxID=469753 RepID=UPI00307C8263